jgi:hypothetical protein
MVACCLHSLLAFSVSGMRRQSWGVGCGVWGVRCVCACVPHPSSLIEGEDREDRRGRDIYTEIKRYRKGGKKEKRWDRRKRWDKRDLGQALEEMR